jgi:hypothetical protein
MIPHEVTEPRHFIHVHVPSWIVWLLASSPTSCVPSRRSPRVYEVSQVATGVDWAPMPPSSSVGDADGAPPATNHHSPANSRVVPVRDADFPTTTDRALSRGSPGIFESYFINDAKIRAVANSEPPHMAGTPCCFALSVLIRLAADSSSDEGSFSPRVVLETFAADRAGCHGGTQLESLPSMLQARQVAQAGDDRM